MFILQHAIGVNGEGMWNRLYRKTLRDRSRKAVVTILQPGHFVFCDEVLPLLFISVEADAKHHQWLSLEFLGDLPYMRQSLPAGPTPSRPEVEQHDFSGQVVH